MTTKIDYCMTSGCRYAREGYQQCPAGQCVEDGVGKGPGRTAPGDITAWAWLGLAQAATRAREAIDIHLLPAAGMDSRPSASDSAAGTDDGEAHDPVSTATTASASASDMTATRDTSAGSGGQASS